MRIGAHLNGPPGAGQGGYVAGSLAVRLRGPGADVWLRAPAPLETDLREAGDDQHLELWDGVRLIAEADAVEVAVDPVPFVDLEQARAAGRHYPGAASDLYDGCFGCGHARPDGLRIGPGPVSEGLVACVYEPRGRVAPEWIWAALDCASGWAWPMHETPLVTGRLTGGMLEQEPLDPSGPYVVVAAQLERRGRRRISASAMFTAAGHRVAAVRGTWLTMDTPPDLATG
jgi:hypothetical protein